MTESVNPTLGKAEDLFKEIGWDNLVGAVLTYFKINFRPINSIVFILTDAIFAKMREVVDLGYLVFKNPAARREFDACQVTLRILERDKGLSSLEYKKARENAKIAFAKHIAFNG